MTQHRSRRSLLSQTGTVLAAAAMAGSVKSRVRAAEAPLTAPARSAASEPFKYCLNTSTIRGANLTIVEELEITARAGYHAIEPWVGEIVDYQKRGGSLKDLSKRIGDLGLTVEDAIGFEEWIVDDDTRRARGLAGMKRDMELVAQIGGKRIAAPPIGANQAADPMVDLHKAAERYRALLDLGEKTGVQPLVELWGPSRNLSRLGDVALVALEARHPHSSMLLDFYHLHKGGSDFAGLRLLNGAALHVIHTNDWPDLPREKLTDADRVFPGDGIAPFAQILPTLRDSGFRGFLSLELFNRNYWKQSPLKVATEGIRKMREVVQKNLA